MKTNNLLFVTNLFKSLTIAILVLTGAIASAKAQDSMPSASSTALQNVPINGLFTPTAAQRFYQAGRDDFEREVDLLAAPERYLDGDILQIDEGALQQIQEYNPVPEGKPDNFYQLDIEVK